MYNALTNKRLFKVSLRRFNNALGTSAERVPRTLYEVLERPERRSCRKLLALVFCIPIAFYFYLQMPIVPRYYEPQFIPPELTTVLQVTTVSSNILERTVENTIAIKSLYYNGPKEPIARPNEALILLRKSKYKASVTIEPGRYSTKYTDYVSDVVENETSSSTSKTTTKVRRNVPECFYNVSSDSDKVVLNTSNVKISLDQVYPMVQDGGYYKPSDCWTKHKLAIIVPYRNRSKNLSTFLFNIHPFLIKQKLEYRIFVIEQYSNNNEFNRGRLLNAGFKETRRFGDWHCVVFHDADLLPLSARVLYTCPKYPRHMSSTVIDLGRRTNTSSPISFGGVTILSPEHYEKANGHSNWYWGWGGEDYDMFWRLRAAGIPVVRYNRTIAKYLALSHPRPRVNPVRYRLLHRALDRWQDDGLNTLRYRVISTTMRHLFTHLLIDINPLNENILL